MAFPCRGAGTGNLTAPRAHSQGRSHIPGNPPFPAPLGARRRGSGWGRGARPRRGRVATPAHRTDLARDPQAAPSGCPCSAASDSGRPARSDSTPTARQLAPAPAGGAAASGGAAPVKERPAAEQLAAAARRAAPRPRRGPAPSFAYRPPAAAPPTASPAARPARPAHLICIAPARGPPARLHSRRPAW